MQEYNRDGPQEETLSWMGIIFSMVAGFLLGGSPCLGAAFLFFAEGRDNPKMFFVLLMIAPFAALSGGIILTWLAWKRLK